MNIQKRGKDSPIPAYLKQFLSAEPRASSKTYRDPTGDLAAARASKRKKPPSDGAGQGSPAGGRVRGGT